MGIGGIPPGFSPHSPGDLHPADDSAAGELLGLIQPLGQRRGPHILFSWIDTMNYTSPMASWAPCLLLHLFHFSRFLTPEHWHFVCQPRQPRILFDWVKVTSPCLVTVKTSFFSLLPQFLLQVFVGQPRHFFGRGWSKFCLGDFEHHF